MKKICVQNLGMIVTERCNLNCDHCMRGGCSNKDMSDEVIEATLDQFLVIGNLSICGGEPTLALDRLEKIFSYIVEKIILVNRVSVVINGTIYSDEFLRLLDYIDSYIISYSKKFEKRTEFAISWDKYHHSEIERLKLTKQYLENIKLYKSNRHFLDFYGLNGKLFREGNASKLDSSLTVPLRPMRPLITYTGKDNKLDIENGLCNIGPIVCVNVNGTITECDASIINQETLYNYGNVLTDSIESVFLKRKALVLTPKKWNRETDRQMLRYESYDK